MAQTTTAVRQFPTFDCLVCGGKTRHYHLETNCCGPCASFYRRTIRERLVYTCDDAGRCEIGQKNQRLACRACRLKRLEQLGARLPSQKSADSPPAVPEVRMAKPAAKQNGASGPRLPILDRLLRGFDHFLTTQRSVLAITHPEVSSSPNKLITMPKLENLDLKAKLAVFILEFYNSSFGPFSKLTKAQQQKVAGNAYLGFDLLEKGWLTSLVADQMDEWSMVVFNGVFVNMNPKYVDYYYRGYIPEELFDDYLSHSLPILKKMLKNVHRFAELKCRKVDAVAMMMLNLWIKIEYADAMTPELLEYKEAMLKEWSTSLAAEYGAEQATHRLAQLMAFFYEVMNVAEQSGELGVIQQMVLSKFNVNAHCHIADLIETLDLGTDEDDANQTKV
ncbi:Nuclear receptor subfamily 2 group F member 6, protein [Aphelenchoides fujianensis]|nr:Nuclear receptor subfamily 2 group F member 6, protein [Aphelenchoides fujianensis]